MSYKVTTNTFISTNKCATRLRIVVGYVSVMDRTTSGFSRLFILIPMKPEVNMHVAKELFSIFYETF